MEAGSVVALPSPRTDFLAMRPVLAMRTAAVLMTCGVACNNGASGPIAPTPFQLTVEPERQWSGGEIRLHGMVEKERGGLEVAAEHLYGDAGCGTAT